MILGLTSSLLYLTSCNTATNQTVVDGEECIEYCQESVPGVLFGVSVTCNDRQIGDTRFFPILDAPESCDELLTDATDVDEVEIADE